MRFYIFISDFLKFRWNSVTFGALLINILLSSELVFQGNLYDHFLAEVKDINLKKSKKNAFTRPTFLVFNWFVRFHRTQFKKITNKAMKTTKTHLFGHL